LFILHFITFCVEMNKNIILKNIPSKIFLEYNQEMASISHTLRKIYQSSKFKRGLISLESLCEIIKQIFSSITLVKVKILNPFTDDFHHFLKFHKFLKQSIETKFFFIISINLLSLVILKY